MAVRQARVASVMAAVQLDQRQGLRRQPDAAGRYAAQRWGFLGYVVGDCGAVDDIWKHHKQASGPAEAAAAALRAGTDLDCGRAYRNLDVALARGLITEADLDRTLVRLFSARFRLGLFDPPERVLWSRYGPEMIESTEHLALARDVAAALDRAAGEPRRRPAAGAESSPAGGGRSDGGRLAVLLANYHGIPTHPVKLLDGVRAAADAPRRRRRLRARLAADRDDARRDREGRGVAREADAVVAFVGLDPRLEGEEFGTRFNPGGDRLDLDMPPAQRELLRGAAGDRQAGDRGAHGRQRAGGSRGWRRARPPSSTPGIPAPRAGTRSRTSCSATSTRPGGCRSRSTARRPICRRSPATTCAGGTYRYFEGEPLYGFGHGLSYTTFRYSGLALSAARSRPSPSEVENTGAAPATRSVQVYVMPRNRPPYAPRRWLGGYARVSLAAGEKRRIRVGIAKDALHDGRRGRHAASVAGRRGHRCRRPPAGTRRSVRQRHGRRHHDIAPGTVIVADPTLNLSRTRERGISFARFVRSRIRDSRPSMSSGLRNGDERSSSSSCEDPGCTPKSPRPGCWRWARSSFASRAARSRRGTAT
jgi:beta-glucosidase